MKILDSTYFDAAEQQPQAMKEFHLSSTPLIFLQNMLLACNLDIQKYRRKDGEVYRDLVETDMEQRIVCFSFLSGHLLS